MTAGEQFVEEMKAGSVRAFVVAVKGADAHDLGPADLVRRKHLQALSIPVWPSEEAARQHAKGFEEVIVVGLNYSEFEGLLAKFADKPLVELILSPKSGTQPL